MGRPLRTFAAVACCLLLCGRAGLAQTDEARTVKLHFEAAGGVSAIYTPMKAISYGIRFSGGNSGPARVNIGGKNRLIAARFVGSGYMLAVDCNGDDKISSGEWAAVNLRRRIVNFLLRIPGGDKPLPYAVRCVDVRVGVHLNQVNRFSGRVAIDCCMAGTFNDHAIRLLDDNLDGKFTQDGKDAIAIGSSPGAMPLYKQHQVGRYHYELEVASDGTSVTFRPLKDLELGLVEVPVAASVLRCLMIADESAGRCYDVRTNGLAGIPAGTYSLSYAVLGAGKRIVIAAPSAKSLSYPVTANMVNILRFGGPARVTFRAYHNIRHRQIRVNTPFVLHGIGGERYDLRFAGYHRYGDPQVVFSNGHTALTSSFMTYNDEDVLLEYHEWIPRGFTRKTGKIILTIYAPVFGKCVGVYPLADVLEGKRLEAPDPKQPAVATRKLPDGITLGKRPPKPAPRPAPAPPKPTPPPTPRPRPATRPVKPKSVDPEHDAYLLLNLAKTYLKRGLKDQGVATLKEVVKKYRGTAAAKEADLKLIDIEIEQESK